MDCSSTRLPCLPSTISWSLLKLMSIESSPSPPALSLSQHRGLFQRVGSLHQVAKVWSFSFSISPSNVYSVLISWMHFVCVYIYIHIHCCWLFTTVYHLPQLLVSHVHLICDPMGCSLLGSSVLGISQARILEWVAIAFSRGFPNPRIKPESPALAGGFVITEPPGNLMHIHTGTRVHTHTHTSTIPDWVLGLGVLWQTGQAGSLFSSCRRRRQMDRNMVGRDGEV